MNPTRIPKEVSPTAQSKARANVVQSVIVYSMDVYPITKKILN